MRASGIAAVLILSVALVATLGMNRLALALGLPGMALLVWRARSRSPSKTLSEALAKAVIVLAATGLAVALADTALRLLVTDSAAGRPEALFGLRWPADPRLTKMLPQRTFEGEIWGDLAGMSGVPAHRRPRPATFVTDRLGFRNGAFPDTPVDMIVLGDSFGLGVGTTQSEILSTRLARLGNCRTYNLSYIGSPWHELVRLKSELPHIPVRPGTVVLWLLFSGNDLTEKYRKGLEAAEPRGVFLQALTRFEAFRRRSPVRRMVGSIFRGPARVLVRPAPDGLPFLFYKGYAERLTWTVEDVRTHKNFSRLREVVAEMKRFCATRKLEVAVAIVPTKPEVYRWLLEDRPGPPPAGFASAVTDLCATLGIPCLDLTPLFCAEARRLDAAAGEYLWWHDDTHWNGRGHAFAARCIQERLLKR